MEQAFIDAFTGAAKNFNQTLLGSVLLVYFILSVVFFRFLAGMIKEVKEELAKERAAHQKTRDEQIADIRNFANVGSAVESMTRSQDRQQALLLELAGRMTRP